MARKYEIISKLAEETAKEVVKMRLHGSGILPLPQGYINIHSRNSY